MKPKLQEKMLSGSSWLESPECYCEPVAQEVERMEGLNRAIYCKADSPILGRMVTNF